MLRDSALLLYNRRKKQREAYIMDHLEKYYSGYDEDGRLLSRHGQVEYTTTMKYIHEYLRALPDARVLELGAGTGRYSIALAREGYAVTALELTEHNIEILKSKLDGSEPIELVRGSALDLSRFPDGGFDMTLMLGPMYHLYTREDKLRALKEALRVTRPGGIVMVAYCMNEATVISYVFCGGHLRELREKNMLTDDWHCISKPEDIFELIRSEEIEELDRAVGAERIKLVATDGATNYLRPLVDSMDDETFAAWLDYHLSTCERQDTVGASHHTLDILRRP